MLRSRAGCIRQTVTSNQVCVFCGGDVFDAAGTDVGSFCCPSSSPLVK
jgi:hypothetical protein